jgi:hypothetical protein
MSKEELKINIRLPEHLHKGFRELGGNTSQTAILAIESCLTLRKYAVNDLIGLFTSSEWKYLIDISNATIFQPEFGANKSMLIARIQDADKLEGTGARWGVDMESFINKVCKLSYSQVYYIQLECYLYWYGQPDKSPQNLDIFIERFL